MWNRIVGPKGFDTDAVLPYRERLIVCYVHDGYPGTGEAFVDNGIWYWWDKYSNKVKVEMENYQLVAWTPYPWNLVGKK